MEMDAALHGPPQSRRHLKLLTVVVLSLASGLLIGSLVLPSRDEVAAQGAARHEFPAPPPGG